MTESWSFERERTRMDAIADQAHRRVLEIEQFKDLSSPAYQREYDDALAKYYA